MRAFIPPWLWVAEVEARQGVLEIAGELHNERILQYHDTTKLDASTDEVPWCSSFVNWCMHQVGLPKTASARARSWLRYGIRLDYAAHGCIAVLKRGRGDQPGRDVVEAKGHVGFLVDADGDTVWLLGGNQSNRVCVKPYPWSSVLDLRYPKE